ncbi:hypothetical protein EVAR_14886_1 [Eumeta japonica]|uniref:Uncharacterized protein n=1 Tax=Eumeta variegata TaxID=151549 RepID=A0A4C1V4P1_EUMVA|nr:hypothetical protein EVAR_14886_1 [Eumeta japonica]
MARVRCGLRPKYLAGERKRDVDNSTSLARNKHSPNDATRWKCLHIKCFAIHSGPASAAAERFYCLRFQHTVACDAVFLQLNSFDFWGVPSNPPRVTPGLATPLERLTKPDYRLCKIAACDVELRNELC